MTRGRPAGTTGTAATGTSWDASFSGAIAGRRQAPRSHTYAVGCPPAATFPAATRATAPSRREPLALGARPRARGSARRSARSTSRKGSGAGRPAGPHEHDLPHGVGREVERDEQLGERERLRLGRARVVAERGVGDRAPARVRR